MFKANKEKAEEKIIKKFISLLDKGYEVEYCFIKFPFFKPYRKELELYFGALNKIKGFKSIKPSEKFEKNTLEKIYKNAQEDEELLLQENMVLPTAVKLKRPFLKPAIAFISAFLFLTFSYTGTVFASENSIPGDILYNVKLSGETIQTSFTPSYRQGSLHFKFLNRRIVEANIILNKNINIPDEEMNNLLESIDLEFQKCNEHRYFNMQEREAFNNEINCIKMETQERMRMRMRDGSGNNNADSGHPSSTDSTISGNGMKGSSNMGNKGSGYGGGKK